MTTKKGISRRGALLRLGTVATSLPMAAASARAAASGSLASAVERLRIAQLNGDGAELDTLLHPLVNYMHSSGFSQTKADLLKEQAGKRIFAGFDYTNLSLQQVGATGIAAMTIDQTKNLPNGTTRSSRIRVLQTWGREKSQWRLLTRASAIVSPTRQPACPAKPG